MNKFLLHILLFLISISYLNVTVGQLGGIPTTNPPKLDFLSNDDGAFRLLSESVIPVSAGLPIFYLTKGFIKKDKELQMIGFQYAGTLIINEVLTDFIKYSAYSNYGIPTGFFTNPPGNKIITSIPSRHGTYAFATAANISMQNPKWYVVVPAYLWASGVVYSRYQFGENYITNLAGSVLIGVGSAYLNRFLIKTLFAKKKKEKIMNNYLLLK